MKHLTLALVLLLTLGAGFAMAEAPEAAPSPAESPQGSPGFLFAADDAQCEAVLGNGQPDYGGFGDPSQPQQLSCSAQRTCFGGNVVSCTGSTQCISMCNGAYCDGQLTECTCDAPGVCTGEWADAYCGCRSCGGSAFFCRCCWCINNGVNCVANCSL